MVRQDLTVPAEIGVMLLIHGAEIFRVEQTIERVAIALGADRVNSFVTLTGLFTSVEIEGQTHTFVRRIRSRGYNLAAVVEINDLSRRFCAGEMPVSTLLARLEVIRQPTPDPFRRWKMALASGFGSLGFALLLGLTSISALSYATLNGFLVSLSLDLIASRFKVPDPLAALMSSFFLSTMTFFYPGLSGAEQNLVNLGGLFLLLPGVPLSTSIRELANGDLLSGISRLAEALITLTMIAAGVITSFTFMPLLLGVLTP